MTEPKKEQIGNALLIKVCKERLKTFDAKICKTLLEVCELLIRTKTKQLSEFIEILNEVRPEAMTSLLVEVQGNHQEKQ
jgi:hypothetical protein